MLEIVGPVYRHCDRVSRRGFVAAGAFGFGGWTLADLLRAESAAGIGSSSKSIVNVHLDGGPPQLDTIDLKPEAPVEIRGEFKPIATKVSGIQVCELLPKLASLADRFAFIRTLVGSAGAHDAFQCQSGYAAKDLKSQGGRPAQGCVLARLLGRPDDVAPPFVDLMQGRPFVRDSARPGFLGPAYRPFRPDISALFARELEPGMKNELARRGADHSVSFKLHPGLNAGSLNDRTSLLAQIDRVRRQIDGSGTMDALDSFTQQAVGILTSGRFADAMDLSREDPRIVDRYTPAASEHGTQSYTSEGPESARKFLLARRLIEAGVRCVSISISDFDTHSNNFARMRQLLPIVDHGLHAFVTDLESRGMLGDVSIVVWGEFGRTPRIDPKTAGRHHWPQVGPALLAGGGMPGGVVIGETDRTASAVRSRPVDYKEVFATLYQNLGIDPRHTTLPDLQGRPQFLLDSGEPIRELA